jgi:hypothetical protein
MKNTDRAGLHASCGNGEKKDDATVQMRAELLENTMNIGGTMGTLLRPSAHSILI